MKRLLASRRILIAALLLDQLEGILESLSFYKKRLNNIRKTKGHSSSLYEFAVRYYMDALNALEHMGLIRRRPLSKEWYNDGVRAEIINDRTYPGEEKGWTSLEGYPHSQIFTDLGYDAKDLEAEKRERVDENGEKWIEYKIGIPRLTSDEWDRQRELMSREEEEKAAMKKEYEELRAGEDVEIIDTGPALDFGEEIPEDQVFASRMKRLITRQAKLRILKVLRYCSI